jgi:hypothetical protein
MNKKISLWQEINETSLVSFNFEHSGYTKVKLWYNKEEQALIEKSKKEEREKQEEVERLNKLSEQKKLAMNEINSLQVKKNELISKRLKIEELNRKLNEAKNLYTKNRFAETNSLLNSILRDDTMKNLNTDLDYLSAMFYSYKFNELYDKLIEVSKLLYSDLNFDESNYELFYDIALANEEFGDISIAKNIYKRFIDSLAFDYKDVSKRYKNI